MQHRRRQPRPPASRWPPRRPAWRSSSRPARHRGRARAAPRAPRARPPPRRPRARSAASSTKTRALAAPRSDVRHPGRHRSTPETSVPPTVERGASARERRAFRVTRLRPSGRPSRRASPRGALGEPLGADGHLQRPATRHLACTPLHRARARRAGPGSLARAKSPRGPTSAAPLGAQSEVGGWVSPLGASLVRGRLGWGVSKGGNQGGGRAARPCATSWPADLHHFPGRAGERGGRSSPPAVTSCAADPWGAHGTRAPCAHARSGEALQRRPCRT